MEIFLIAVVCLLPLFWAIATFNRLVGLRNHVENAWSQIDTELKRRHDLIPNLVDTVKGYAAHEREVLEALIEARNQAEVDRESAKGEFESEGQVTRRLTRFFALSEDYPELKASENFLQLQEELADTEDRIQAARRFYNGNIRELNTLVQSFPSMIIAGMGNFSVREYFEVESAAVRTTPDVELS